MSNMPTHLISIMTTPSVVKIFRRQSYFQQEDSEIRMHYIEALPLQASIARGSILLINGFPQTSCLINLVILPVAATGCRVIAPGYCYHGFRLRCGRLSIQPDLRQGMT